MKNVITRALEAKKHNFMCAAIIALTLVQLPHIVVADNPTVGPWTHWEDKAGRYAYKWTQNNIIYYCATKKSYNDLNGGYWGQLKNFSDIDGETHDNRYTITMCKKAPGNTRASLFSIYSHTRTVPAYARVRLSWNYHFTGWTNNLAQSEALYAMQGTDQQSTLQNIKSLEVDYTAYMSDKAGSQYRIYSVQQSGRSWRNKYPSKTFDFDNHTGSSEKTITWALLHTLVIENQGGEAKDENCWTAIANKSYAFDTCYYKIFKLCGNGSVTDKGVTSTTQEIETKGNLMSCPFQHSGIIFDGWNTNADGTGTAYQDGAEITVTESNKGEVTLYAQWRPIITKMECALIQAERKVRIAWKISSKFEHGGKFVIYRGDTKIGSVACNKNLDSYFYEDENTKTDHHFPYEKEVKYKVYYVANGWPDDTRRDDLHAEASANTYRSLSILNVQAKGMDTKVVITWTSDGYEYGWGNSFVIFADGDSVTTIMPSDKQTSFQWEHRSVDEDSHPNRENGHEGDIWYTLEPLDACTPINYKIVGYIDGKRFGEDGSTFGEKSIPERAPQSGSEFTSIDASKGAYAGMVKLAWRINPWGSILAKTYTVERHHADSTDAWTTLNVFKSDNVYNNYTDDTALPGEYYEYRVTVAEKCSESGKSFQISAKTIGFAQALGTVSGRVTYGTSGIAVAGVDVVAQVASNVGNAKHFHSIYFDNNIGRAEWVYPASYDAADVFKNDFSIQLWVAPDAINQEQTFLRTGKWSVGTDAEGLLTLINGSTTHSFNKIHLVAHQYDHLTITHRDSTVICYIVRIDNDGLQVVTSDTVKLGSGGALDMTGAKALTLGGFQGYMDEFRLWTKVLTTNDILNTYDRLLVGNEADLDTYWTFDAGLRTHFFDFSRSGSVYHGHHGTHENNVRASAFVPSRLALKATTDIDGNYTIAGIPFVGDGTSYTIVPTLGVHEFNPSQQQRFISNSSLVHNSVNFDDISSFTVNGVVYYENTDYPVEGCNFYVDGTICAKDGELVTSDADGRFSISVPIGEHYIQVKKNGHEFANAGRYPADSAKVGTRHNFDRPIDGLEFKDATLVNFTGRVAGGKIEGDTVVGFGRSHNNIGMATITMRPSDTRYRLNVVEQTTGTVVSYENNTNELPVASSRPDTINSHAWRGKGDNCNKIFIRTDSLTGEFSALVPPLDYTVDSINVHSAGLKLLDSPLTFDMTNPLNTYTDSVKDEQDTTKMHYYEYHTLLRQTYRSAPVFIVKQDGHDDGSFGMDSCVIADAYGQKTLHDIHHLNTDSTAVVYTYGYPLFRMGDPYTFKFRGYEVYENKDDNQLILIDTVPLSNVSLNIDNALSATQTVLAKDTLDMKAGDVVDLTSIPLTLDEQGEADYRWQCGIPNPSGNHTRTLNIYYQIDGAWRGWNINPLIGIALGDFPLGNNFVTEGPDDVSMILRDPPGSKSFATWEEGTIKTVTHIDTWTRSTDDMVKGRVMIGVEEDIIVAGLSIKTFEDYVDVELGTHRTQEWVKSDGYISITKTLTAISTRNLPEYDGADGDVFIGQSTNLIIGKVNNVDLYRSPDDTSKFVIDVKETVSTGMKFATMFNYTQREIEHDMIPKWKSARNQFLQQVPDTTGYVNNTDKPVYLTLLSPDSPDYGDEGTYTMYPPNDSKKIYSDTITTLNSKIKNWQFLLAKNEREKVEAYTNRDNLGDNYINRSFDAGSSVTFTNTNEHTYVHHRDTAWMWTALLNIEGGTITSKHLGLRAFTENEAGQGWSHYGEDDDTESTTFSYTLKDDDVDDLISVDVYSNQGQYLSPIFHTRSGQTSNPYEGKVKTKYYEPGQHTIMESTAQVEVPKISVVNPRVNGITSGTVANYELHLTNESEVGADCYFRLLVADNTDSLGAMILIDGAPLNSGRTIKVPVGETLVKRMQLKQTDVSILNFEGIAIVLASIGQSDPTSKMPVIADTARIWAQFEPSSSPVTLQLSTNVINTNTGTDLTLTMKDFDRYYTGLKAFRMQYKPQGGSWTQFHEYVLKESLLNGSNELLPTDRASIDYTLPMAGKSDGDYTFRIVSVTDYGGKEIYVYSEELPLVKDMNKPRALGLPEPADGILDIGDELSITFNEPILSGELTSTKNFLVTGVLNGDAVDHAVALQANAGITEPAAQTEAAINLSGRDFSLDVWLNIHSAGALLTHGTGKQKMTVATNETGQLVVSLAGSVYTSQETLPRDKWIFVTLSRKIIGDSAKMSFAVAYDDVTQPLFTDKPVPLYYGNGPISVGCGASAAVHELLLWDEARDITTALAQRSVTKSPATRHLIGYWKMNEGEGTVIRDYARNRHMAMTDETWYLNNVNKAVELAAGQQLKVNTSAVSILPDDDYALEFWFKTSQTTETQLLQVGKDTLLLHADGQLTLKSGSHVLPVNNKLAVNDGVWHHIALNVLRMGTAALYIDGNRALTVPAANMAAFGSVYLTVGGNFTGMVDEIRLWGATMNANQLARNRKVRLNGNEPGLELYYPFEEKTLDEYNQVVVRGTGKEMTGRGQDAVISGQPSAVSYTDDVPALREKMTETNVPFSFTASDTKIVLSLDADPAKLEGCTLNFTVRNVRDRNGNNSVEALWSAFVHRGQLMWEDDEIRVEQEMQKGSSFTATLINRSGSAVTWTLGTLHAWLSASVETGTLSPLAQTHITFDVNETTPIGKYEQTIYAIGSNGIEVPLTLYLTVTGDVPEWSVDQSKYESSMTVIGRLEIFNVSSDDPDDVVAAFIDDECRGVAHPEYKARYDSYFLTLQIYGDKDDKNKEIMFRVYDASTGITYSQVSLDTSIPYEKLSLVGKYDNPVLFSVEDKVEQHTILRKGWNWLSVNVAAADMSPKAILNKVADDVLTIKSQSNGYLQHDSIFGWDGQMDTLRNNRMYMVQMKNERDLRLVGRRVAANQTPVSLRKDWNWIGYYELQRLSVADALAGMDPQSGDVIRSQRAISYFDAYEWVGSLTYMEPGAGYIVKNSTLEDKEFAYPSAAVLAAPYIRNYKTLVNEQDSTDFTPVDETAYPFNMILVARVTNSGLVMANTKLYVFADDECRAVGTTDDEGIVYLLIPGEESVALTFKIIVDDKVIVAKKSFDYETDAVVGNHSNPYEILFGSGQGFDSVDESGDHSVQKIFYNGQLYILRNGEMYNAQGARVK